MGFQGLSIAALLLGALVSPSHGCTMIAVGKNATVDGSTLVAHTDDAGGGAADLRLVRVPAQDHPKGSKRAVYDFFGGYPRVVTTERGPHYEPNAELQEELMKPLGFIPQVEHTYAYFDQDYGMVNEVQLSIAESTSGARTVGWPSDLPHGKNLFGIAELSKVALERCDSARCAVQTMGDLAVEYGFYSEDSGDVNNPGYSSSAEALGITDKYGEVWVFHVLTGKDNSSAVWAARRVPDDEVTVIANGFTIREMDLDDPDAFLASPNVHSLAQEMGWWDPEKDGAFDFTAAYGYRDRDPIRPLYVGRRVWRVFDLLAPSLKLDSRLGTVTEYPTYPFSVKPDKLVSIEKIMSILRDHYEGTEYDMTKGVAAGPFGAPLRWDGENKGVTGGWERPISIYRTIYSFIIQARQDVVDSLGGVLWYGQGTPHGTVYVPFSCRQGSVPESYLMGKQSEFHPNSAWWAFDFVNNWSLLRFDVISQDVRAKIAELQAEAIAERQRVEEHAKSLNSTQEMDTYMEKENNEFASSVVTRWWQFAWYLVSKFSDGYITTGEKPEEMVTPGYPKWWLELTEYAKWPGDSFSPKNAVLKDIDENVWHLKTHSMAVKTTDSESHFGPIIQVGCGLVLGVAIGATAMLLVEHRRRVGYQSLV
ncbi:hypothetical protein Poli38472_000606 [Pythium oligandrum]|uniref:Dipeptidase n=1 Tax=Pythium oligandrum TaxID=41045 RepID=A0A8K1CBY2_PYTOL|nr:hypothetical protein Poli38472_000606 [Pythium oligandrum]|eukprot:TMW60564.1 hypothetical protein Poli38472_000606 [Pythium oligandrum]